MRIHVIDANCSWIRSLISALPPNWTVRNYRIYSPQWLPGGKSDLLKCFRRLKLDTRTEEVFVVVPGWNKAPRISAMILKAMMYPTLKAESSRSALLFTFPFYSAVALWAKSAFPKIPLIYHSHDPFEFYSYPPGYIKQHEDALVPACNKVFAITDTLSEDFRARYPMADVQTLGNGVSDSFLETASLEGRMADLERIMKFGRPLVGCIGQINSSYDWTLLENAAEDNPQTQYVFIGNLFEEGAITSRIRKFFTRTNVHWLGPMLHCHLRSVMESFDILLNPLAKTAQNDRRDTLRLYDYLSTSKPVFSTAINCAERHRGLIHIFDDNVRLIAAMKIIPDNVCPEDLAKRRVYISENTWGKRAKQLANTFESMAKT